MGVGVVDIIELILWVTFIDFIFCGIIIASGMWFLCNKVILKTCFTHNKISEKQLSDK